MIVDTTPPLTFNDVVLQMQTRAREDVKRRLFAYFCEMSPPHFGFDDIDNLVEQGIDALDAVLLAYKEIKGRTTP